MSVTSVNSTSVSENISSTTTTTSGVDTTSPAQESEGNLFDSLGLPPETEGQIPASSTKPTTPTTTEGTIDSEDQAVVDELKGQFQSTNGSEAIENINKIVSRYASELSDSADTYQAEAAKNEQKNERQQEAKKFLLQLKDPSHPAQVKLAGKRLLLLQELQKVFQQETKQKALQQNWQLSLTDRSRLESTRKDLSDALAGVRKFLTAAGQNQAKQTKAALHHLETRHIKEKVLADKEAHAQKVFDGGREAQPQEAAIRKVVELARRDPGLYAEEKQAALAEAADETSENAQLQTPENKKKKTKLAESAQNANESHPLKPTKEDLALAQAKISAILHVDRMIAAARDPNEALTDEIRTTLGSENTEEVRHGSLSLFDRLIGGGTRFSQGIVYIKEKLNKAGQEEAEERLIHEASVAPNDFGVDPDEPLGFAQKSTDNWRRFGKNKNTFEPTPSLSLKERADSWIQKKTDESREFRVSQLCQHILSVVR